MTLSLFVGKLCEYWTLFSYKKNFFPHFLKLKNIIIFLVECWIWPMRIWFIRECEVLLKFIAQTLDFHSHSSKCYCKIHSIRILWTIQIWKSRLSCSKKNVQSFQVLKNNWITRQKLMMIWKILMLICSKISWYTHMNCLNCLIECKFWMVSIIKYDNKHFKVINHWLIKSLLFAFWIRYTHDDAGWHVSLSYTRISEYLLDSE